MLHFPRFIRTPLIVLLLLVNLIGHFVPLMGLALIKLLSPRRWRLRCSRGLVAIAESWCAWNDTVITRCTRVDWQIEGDVQGLCRDKNYLLICNHQSWIDTPLLQKVFNRRIPFFAFPY